MDLMSSITILVVLVEAPVGSSDEPPDTGARERFFPASDRPCQLARGEVPGCSGAVVRDYAQADNLARVRLGLQEPSRDLCDEPLSRAAAFRARHRFAAAIFSTTIDFVSKLRRLLAAFFRSQAAKTRRSRLSFFDVE